MSQIDEIAHDLKGGIVSLSKFELRTLLGKGGFGEVWNAVHIPTGTICAVKKLFTDTTDDDYMVEMYCREIRILAQCNHLFLLRLIGFSIQKPYFIVTPYIKNGSLYNYVRKNSSKEPLQPTNNTIIAMGVAYGLMKLHGKGIIHRDLKSPNILLDDKLLPWICDFGIARKEEAKMTKDIGTVNWMAPEQMDSSKYDEKVDVYSYGCVLYEMVCHKIPFGEETAFKTAANVLSGLRPPLPKNQDSLIVKLINNCWQQNPEDRPSMERIFKKFVKGKIYFDGTDMMGIKAMNRLISKTDSKDKKMISKWTEKEKKR